jgi:hypothetical protein
MVEASLVDSAECSALAGAGDHRLQAQIRYKNVNQTINLARVSSKGMYSFTLLQVLSIRCLRPRIND